MTLHEDFRSDDNDAGSSNRKFGLVFAGVFAIVAIFMAWHGNGWWFAPLIVAGAFALAVLLIPERLTPINRAWTWFGLQIAKVTTPIILLLLFLLCFLPTGLIARMLGKDFLRLKRIGAASYWIARDGRSAEQTNLKNQF